MIRHILIVSVFCFSAPVLAQVEGSSSRESINSPESPLHQEADSSDSQRKPQSFTLDPMGQVESNTTLPDDREEHMDDSKLNHHKEPLNMSKDDDDIQTLSRGKYHNGFFGAVAFKATEFSDKNVVLTGFRFGWIANRAIAVGFEGYGIIPTAEYPEIDQYFNSRAVGGYGGLFIEPILYSNKLLHVTFPVSGGAGWLGYIYDWEEDYYYDTDLIDGDVFWYIEPGAGLEMNVSRAFRISTGATYRITQDLNIIRTDSKAFNGWNYFLTFKFGRF